MRMIPENSIVATHEESSKGPVTTMLYPRREEFDWPGLG